MTRESDWMQVTCGRTVTLRDEMCIAMDEIDDDGDELN